MTIAAPLKKKLKLTRITSIVNLRGYTYCSFGEHDENRSTFRQFSFCQFDSHECTRQRGAERKHDRSCRGHFTGCVGGCCGHRVAHGENARGFQAQRSSRRGHGQSQSGAGGHRSGHLQGQRRGHCRQVNLQRAGNSQANIQLTVDQSDWVASS